MKTQIEEQIKDIQMTLLKLKSDLTQCQLKYITFVVIAHEEFKSYKAAHRYLSEYLNLPAYEVLISNMNRQESILAELNYKFFFCKMTQLA